MSAHMKRNRAVYLSVCSAILFITLSAAISVAIDVDRDKLFSGDMEVSSVGHPEDIPGLKLQRFINIFKDTDKLKDLKKTLKACIFSTGLAPCSPIIITPSAATMRNHLSI